MAHRSAFTLIELLVVIAIIAILAVVVVLVLNPAQLLAQSRDADRISDLATLNSAISLYQTDVGGSVNFSLGSSSVAYVSIPDTANSDCSDMSANFLAGGYFHCASSSTYRSVSAAGWIPVNFNAISAGSPFSSLPVDPVNSTSSNLYYSYQTNGSTFRLVATPESQKYQAQLAVNPTMFMAGSNPNLYGSWVSVPSNSTFGTGNFYVMKYDAVCSDGNGNYLNDYNSGYQTYSNSGKACIPANGRQIASLPGGWQVANIPQTTAAQYCASIGAHLLTNAEWQTIAWNTENVASNWGTNSIGGTGAGAMYSGHNDNAPANALPADPSDQNEYAGETNQGGNQRRTLTLSDGAVIWDMAGNVWQWTNDMIQGQNEPYGGSVGFNWREFTAITTWGAMSQQTAGPSNNTWNSSQGIGEIYSDGTSGNTTVYGYLRGGYWGYGQDAGVESLNLPNTPSNPNPGVGFRCAR